jgi:hypothetical protein
MLKNKLVVKSFSRFHFFWKIFVKLVWKGTFLCNNGNTAFGCEPPKVVRKQYLEGMNGGSAQTIWRLVSAAPRRKRPPCTFALFFNKPVFEPSGSREVSFAARNLKTFWGVANGLSIRLTAPGGPALNPWPYLGPGILALLSALLFQSSWTGHCPTFFQLEDS